MSSSGVKAEASDLVCKLNNVQGMVDALSAVRWKRHQVWLRNLGLGSLVYQIEKVCDGSGEDPDCSRSVMGKSISDHLCYCDVDSKGVESSRSCRIVMDPRVVEYGKTDARGNLFLSRDPDTSIMKLRTPSNGAGGHVNYS